MTLLDDIKRLRELSEKATAGPWECSRDRMVFEIWTADEECITVATLGSELASAEEILKELDDPKVFNRRWDDSGFIAAARTALPKLCDALEKAVTVIEGHQQDETHREYSCPACDLLKEWGVE